jgi:DNA-binding SARP family transcriptional activator/tetratricopeptide (TPR) repeat protein
MLVVQLLGRVRVWRDGAETDLGPAGRRAVFALLALAGGEPVTRYELIDALWGDDPPASAMNIVQGHMKHLRHQLEPHRTARTPSTLLPMVGDGYALHLPDDAVDAARFRSLVRAANTYRDDQGAAAELLGEALGLWRGPAPVADVPVLVDHRRVVALAAERRHALARYADAMLATGGATQVIGVLADDASAHPLDESAQARLIRAYQLAGQRARGMAVFTAARGRLDAELGVAPGPELTAAYTVLLGEAGEPPEEPGGSAAPQELPADVPGFVGRAAELSQLDEDLAMRGTSEPGAVIRVICGTAGVGKTALALRWAHRVRHAFPDGHVYLDLRGYDADRAVPPDEALSRLCEAVGVPAREVPLGLDRLAARFRSAVAGRRLLVVLDNAASVAQVRPLLPGAGTCHVLVTSRDRLGGLVALHGARRVQLEPLPETDAQALLRGLIGARVDADPASAAELADRCARLPLALRVAAELAASWRQLGLAAIVDELSDHRRRLDLLDAGGDARAAVREVISWSYRHLDAAAALAFRRLGLHPGADFDRYCVAALADVTPRDAGRLLDVLARAHLVQPSGPSRFGLHDLMRGYALHVGDAEDTPALRRAATGRLLDHYLAWTHEAVRLRYPSWRGYRHDVAGAVPGAPELADTVAAQAWLTAERANLTVLCGYAATHGWPHHAIGLATSLHHHLETGRHVDALTAHTYALAAAREVEHRPAQAHLLTDLGDIHRRLGQYGPAAEHHLQALALHQETGDRKGQARTLSDLGIVEERLGEWRSAAARHHEALALYRAAGDRYGEAAVLVNLGNVHTGLGEHAAAAEAFARAYERFRDLDDDPGQAAALSNLGDVYTVLGRHEQAADRLGDALSIFRRLGHRDGEASVLANLGVVCIRVGRNADAIDHLRQALAHFRDTGHRYGQASALNGLGEALLAAGHGADAVAAHTEALDTSRATGDRDERERAEAGIAAATAGGICSIGPR